MGQLKQDTVPTKQKTLSLKKKNTCKACMCGQIFTHVPKQLICRVSHHVEESLAA